MILKEQIQKRIVELVGSTDNDPADLRHVSHLLQALPIYADMGGCLAFRPDGSFVCLEWETETITQDIEPQHRLVALVKGSEKYPELKVLLPKRPESANDCEACRATGKAIFEEQVLINVFCGKCSGLGWVT